MDRTAHLTDEARAARVHRRHLRWLRQAARRAADAAWAVEAARELCAARDTREALAADAEALHAVAQRLALAVAARATLPVHAGAT